MSQPSIIVEGLSKTYPKYRSGLQRVLHLFGLPFVPVEKYQVLEPVSLQIFPGQAVALVGQNGAGKSTLLKMIAGTLPPTRGAVHFNGRMAAILELGMGFNPEFTGRENAYHVLSMMGFSREQADAVMSEIRAFSEVGKFFDQPVRMYSSGMQVRVAFAVATAYRPDILIVDEALSVGDIYFQHKSFARIREFREQGSTLLFVSHDKSAVLELCDRAILIHEGKLQMDDEPPVVMDYYNALIAQKENSALIQTVTESGVQTHSGSQEMIIESVELKTATGKIIKEVAVNDHVELEILVKANRKVSQAVIGYLIKDRIGHSVYGTNTHHLDQPMDFEQGASKLYRFRFSAALGVGSYSITVAIHSGADHLQHNIDWRDRAYVFEVINTQKPEFVGNAWIPSELEVIDFE